MCAALRFGAAEGPRMTHGSDAPPPPDRPVTPPFSSRDASGGATGPVAIHDAATVVVVRSRAAGQEILMLRRSAGSAFMPSTLVFPGGRLDPEDGPREAAGSWVAAARRECREEASLDLDPATLAWFDTWLTPSAEPRRRYLARFFVAHVKADAGDDARADGHETHDERWASVKDHLLEWEAGTIDLPPPTLAILLRFDRLGTDLLALAELDPHAPILPKYVPMDGRHVVVMPHDPEYGSLPGDGLAVPAARLSGLPCRFVRDEERWRPW